MSMIADSDAFLEQIKSADGRISNPSLQNLLGWTSEKYWKVHQQLFEAGNIEKGKGRGGMVILVDRQNPGAAADVAASGLDNKPKLSDQRDQIKTVIKEIVESSRQRELELYQPVLLQLQANWANRRQLDQCHCEMTAMQGRRETGGSWSRPDITVVGHKKYEYLPDKLLEVFTFEIKAEYDVTIKGVLEALSHREAATRSYVIYYTNKRDFGAFPEASRIEEIAARHGVGVFAARDIEDLNSWDEITAATRATPDPDNLERFIKSTLSDGAKSKLRKWF